MRKILVVVDMQNDFIDGALGSEEAQAIVPKVVEKIKQYNPQDVFLTQDTHERSNYFKTLEGHNFPDHCIEGSYGWKISDQIWEVSNGVHIVRKHAFGSVVLARALDYFTKSDDIEVEVVGLVTDICVISNALLFRTRLPNVTIKVDSSCCVGTTLEAHEAALKVMKNCLIEVY